MNELDWWIANQWEMFKVKDGKSGLEFYRTDKEGNILTIDRSPKWKKLREKTELKEMYIVRYADDFKIFCRDYVTAKKAMYATKLWLAEHLHLQTSDEKSGITNLRKNYSRCIRAIEAIPEQERGYLLTVKLSRAYSNLAVLGDHGEHGTDSEVDGNLIQYAIRLLESVRTQGENDPYWNSRMGYSCLMAYSSAAIAYEYAKRWLALAPDDPAAQKLVRDCEEYLEEEKALEIDLKEREEFIRRETPDDEKGVICK